MLKYFYYVYYAMLQMLFNCCVKSMSNFDCYNCNILKHKIVYFLQNNVIMFDF